MNILTCLVIGYLLGSLSPAALISKIKKANLRSQGTGNLGATNTLMVVGKKYGIIVMFFDIMKAFAAVKIAEVLFPLLKIAGILAGSASVLGHMYPFYLKFKGGKGLASFGGMILAFDPWIFILLLTICLIIMLIVNYGVALTLSAASLFPVLTTLFYKNNSITIVSLFVSVLLIIKHIPVIRRVISGDDIKARTFIKKFIFSKR